MKMTLKITVGIKIYLGILYVHLLLNNFIIKHI